MGRNRKLFIHSQTHAITFRAEEGLPLPPNHLVKEILQTILCRAQTLYPVDASGLIFMSNHCHMNLTIIDPEDLDRFVQYVKRESAHVINRLLGRRKHTIWCDGYDSPQILDVDKAIEHLIYIYTNPQNDNLVETIDQYPGVSSWKMFINEDYEIKKKRIPRSAIKKVFSRVLTKAQQRRIIKGFKKDSLEENTFILKPFAFLQSFCTDMTEDEARELIIEGVRAKEKLLAQERKYPAMGRKRLESQAINAPHTPKKFGKRMICLSSFIELRRSFISWYKGLCAQASEAYRVWKSGDRTTLFPPGMFAPDGQIHRNFIPT